MPEDTKGLVVAIALIALLLLGLPLLIVWLMDRRGGVGTVVRKLFGLIAVSFGLVLMGWIAYNLIAPTDVFPGRMLVLGRTAAVVLVLWTALGFFSRLSARHSPPNRLFVLPFDTAFALLNVGWSWLSGSRAGVESQNIDFDAPELVESVTRARATLPEFREQVARHVDDAYIKFPMVTDRGATEHIWAYVHHYEDGVFNVSLVDVPYTQEGEYQVRRDVPEAEVEDWQIMLPDGRIKGAYSLIGAFEYLENNGVRLSKQMRRQRDQLVDARFRH